MQHSRRMSEGLAKALLGIGLPEVITFGASIMLPEDQLDVEKGYGSINVRSWADLRRSVVSPGAA